MTTAKPPHHIAIIPDGNRRWAKAKGKSALRGHLRGLKNFERLARFCQERGIKALTLFGFSSDNWRRNKEEITYLFRLIGRTLERNIVVFQKNKTKVTVIGSRENLPSAFRKTIEKVEAATAANKDFSLILAIDFGGRGDLVQAVKKIAAQGLPAAQITQEVVEKHLQGSKVPDPDIIIRTAGEKRLSNFLLWQCAYAELFFSDKYWPDFGEDDLEQILEEFAARQRRFGR